MVREDQKTGARSERGGGEGLSMLASKPGRRIPILCSMYQVSHHLLLKQEGMPSDYMASSG